MIVCSHLYLPKNGRSLMMYSKVVNMTLNDFMRSWNWIVLRSVWDPLYTMAVTPGAHFSNLSVQLGRVDNGAMTRNGPGWCFFSMRKVMRGLDTLRC